jgi:hypothetical protein
MKEAVRKLVTEWNETLHLPGRTYWKLDGVSNPRAFFRHLPKIFPHGMTMLIEGLEIGLSARSLYQEYPALYTKKVACDSVSPTPDSFHVEFSASFSDRLCQLIQSQGLAAAFYHFKGYSEREVVFTFHDAFKGELALSSNLPAVAVRDFATSQGRMAEHTVFPVDPLKQLISIDRVLNPPWWRRALRIFERKTGA